MSILAVHQGRLYIKTMKVIAINGSPRVGGNDSIALNEAIAVLKENGVDVRLYEIGTKAIHGCVACGYCHKAGRCVFDDDLVNEIAKDFEDANGIIVSSPVYYASANGTILSLMQRLFYSTHYSKKMKVGAAIAVARRAGTVTTFDQINRFYSISEMPIVTSSYWNDVFGRIKGEASQDEEGLATMRNLARNMVFLMKAIEAEKEKEGGYPETERAMTNFIR